MKLRKLQISSTYAAPPSYVHSTLGAFGKRGTGKSHAGQLHAEQLLEMGIQVVALDPVGAWWGLRSSADGKSPGFPIIVFGGEHGDVPLDPSSGEVLAIAIAEHGFSCVIDLSLMRKGERLRFCADFLETLYRVNREAMHLFIDEADVVAPQRPIDPQQARCLGAADELVRRGRQRGIGCTLISQRPQVVNKDLLSQVDQLLVFRLSHPKDIGAIDAWISDHVDPKMAKEMLASLPTLEVGEGWIWAPDLGVFERIRVNPKTTYDSGRTPKPGERIRRPKQLAQVDLKQLGEAMAASAEQAKASDPKALRATVLELRAELEKAKASKVRTVTERVEILGERNTNRLLGAIERFEKVAVKIDAANAGLRVEVDAVRKALMKSPTISTLLGDGTKMNISVGEAAKRREAEWDKVPALPGSGYTSSGPKSPRKVNFNTAMAELREEKAGGPSKMERAMLIALADEWSQHANRRDPDKGGLTKKQIRIRTGYRDSGPVSKAFARMLAKQWISAHRDQLVITTSGQRALGDYKPLPTGPELRALLLTPAGKLSSAARKLLGVYIDNYPHKLTRGEAREKAGYSDSGPVSKGFAQLIDRNYVVDHGREGMVLSEELLDADARELARNR